MKDLPLRTRFQHWLARKQKLQNQGPTCGSTLTPFPSQGTIPLFSSPPPVMASPPPASGFIPSPLSIEYNQHALGLIVDLYGSDSDAHSPINILPPEILGEIFMLCLPPRIWNPPAPNIRDAPMLLCQVCSFWRELALSLPMLWSSFSPTYRQRIHAGRVSLIQLWLERSQTRPLSLSFDLREAEPLRSCMTRLFLDHIHRWVDVAFDVDDNCAKDLFAIPGWNAHLLDRFGINAPKCSTETMDEISSILLSFPNLRRLRWDSESAPTGLLGMAFSRLTHIKLLCPVPFNECIRFLARCSQICDIRISKIEPSPVPLTLPIVTLPHLSSINISIGNSELLDYFTLPSLRSLLLGQIRLRNFENLAARSLCKLDAFYLVDKKATEEELIHCLRMPCLRSLRELHINSPRMTDQTLAVLRYSTGSEANLNGNILPHLETFSSVSCGTTDGVFADMVASRWRPNQGSREKDSPVSLKEIDISLYPGEHHVIDRSRLQEFAASGLKVSSLY